MKFKTFMPLALMHRSFIAIFSASFLLSLAACSGAPKPKATPLTAISTQTAAKPVWNTRLGAVNFPLQVRVLDNTLLAASSAGTVAALDAASGKELWRAEVGEPIAAGVGSDGKVTAVVTRANELVALADGRQLWRYKLGAQVYSAPFVAGERVFVLAADRSVSAFDGQTGAKLWQHTRSSSEPLVLSQAGVMLAVGDTLVVGFSGRLAGLDPSTGKARWEVAVAAPRGIDDVERLADLVGPASRLGASVCVRAFQASVACVNAKQGSLAWTKPARGIHGLAGDEQWVLGTETDSKVFAWRRSDGEVAWNTDSLRYRDVSAPLLLGGSVVVGDFEGWVHFLSSKDGALLGRVATDGSAIMVAPVFAGNTLVVVTVAGGIYGFALQ